MSRAILVAAVGRDLAAEVGNCVCIPGATNGVVRAWDTNDRERFEALADKAITIYTRRADVPAALVPFLIQVRRYDDAALSKNPTWKPLAAVKATDYLRVTNNGVTSVKVKSATTAADKPTDWLTVHEWLGVPDDLGL